MNLIKTAVFSLNNDFRYFAEVVKNDGRYYYTIDNVSIEINRREYDGVIKNPKLYYFSHALRLHFLIEEKKKNPNFIREFN